MPATLVPKHDLLVKANSLVKIGDPKKGNHLHGIGGSDVSDSTIQKPFVSAGLHVCGCNKKIKEKLESLADALVRQDKEHFNVISDELKQLKPSQKCLDQFGREQMKLIVPIATFDILEISREMLNSLGIRDSELEDGYQHGLRALQSMQK